MPADNVVDFTGITKLPLDPDRVLSKAIGQLGTAVVIGWDKEGYLYTASSEPDGKEMLWLLELARRELMRIGEGQ